MTTNVEHFELTIPKSIVDSLPADSESTVKDMEKAVNGWERVLNNAVDSDDDDEMMTIIVDMLEKFEDRWEEYDDYVVELRAWGQSPIYAMAWRDLHGAIVQQIQNHDDLTDRINRERNARLVDDGIRPGSN